MRHWKLPRVWIVGVMALAIAGLAALTLKADEKKGEEKEGKEVKVKFDDVPPAVQKTMKEAAGDAKITDVDKETEDGKTVYETDVKIDGKNWEIRVAEDGKLISKKIDNEEDEKKGDKK